MGSIRPRLGHFLEKWVTVGPSEAVERELDDVRSEWPWDANSGWAASQNVNSIVQLVAGVSSWWFKPETVIVTANGTPAATAVARFYDGLGSRPLFDLAVQSGYNTQTLQQRQLRGIFCVSGLYASIQSGWTVRAGGLLLASIPTGPL